MYKSTFKWIGPLSPDSPLFRGRQVEIKYLMDYVENDVNSYSLLYGARQTGKTSLMMKLEAHVPKSVCICRVDFSGIPDANPSDAFSHLAKRITLSVEDHLANSAQHQHLGEISEKNTNSRKYIVSNLNEHFSLDEIQQICFNMEIDSEQFNASTKGKLVRELVMYCERCGLIEKLVIEVHEVRPQFQIVRLHHSESLLGDDHPVKNAEGLLTYLIRATSSHEIERMVLILERIDKLPPETQTDVANVIRFCFTNRFESTYRSLDKLMVIIAGGVELFSLATKYMSPLNNVCTPSYLGDLDYEDAVGLVRDGLTGIGIPNDTAQHLGICVYECVEGHPYLTQRLAGALESQWARNKKLVELDLDEAIEVMLSDDPLLRQIHEDTRREGIIGWGKELIDRKIRFSRSLDNMAKFELIGLAKASSGRWIPRNTLMSKALMSWIGKDANGVSGKIY